MRRSARSRDDHLDPASVGGLDVFEKLIRSSMGRKHPNFEWNRQRFKRRRRVRHRFPIRFRTHYDTDQCLHSGSCSSVIASLMADVKFRIIAWLRGSGEWASKNLAEWRNSGTKMDTFKDVG